MTPLTPFEMWYGRDEPPPAVIALRAGLLDLEFQDGDLRYIRYGRHELIRRIYSAVRDVNWNTIPARYSDLAVDASADHFRIQFEAYHEAPPLAFRWQAIIEGRPDGTIEYTLNGVAESDFRYCRIGFCVLHPVLGIAGSPYRAVTPDGPIAGVLPELIEPQRMADNGFELPIFPSCSRLAVEMPGGITVITEFEGDLFETEDQRNWTDGSFKTYCTPIALGYPHAASKGQVFYQKVRVRAEALSAVPYMAPPRAEEPIRLTLGNPAGRLPRLGFGMASHGGELDAREADRIARLLPAHLRVDLYFHSPGWITRLDQAITAARQTGAALELALFLTDDPAEALSELGRRLAGVPVARVIVFHQAEAPLGTTSPRWMALARQHLSAALPGALLVGGTNGNFAEVNRQRPDITTMDGVAYTVNPQVHLPDERSLIEAIEAQRDTVITARSFSGQLPISVSTVTLKPPFNQAAREEEAPPAPDELPPSVDPRQMSLFAAAWTVGSLRALALGHAASVTYYETTGWRGLIETKAGSPLPAKFRSAPGMIFPVYWVFVWLAGAQGAPVLEVTADRPLVADALAFRQEGRLRVLAANLQPCSQAVHLGPLPDGRAALLRLNEDTFGAATGHPDTFPDQAQELAVAGGEVTLTMKPYETALLEISLR